MKIGELFQRDINRRVNPVVKVEDRDESELQSELGEYVVTPQIGRHFVRVIEQHYLEQTTLDTAIWISGFFGSGKSLFLKLLCLLLANESISGLSVIDQLSYATDEKDVKRAFQTLRNRPPALVISTHMESDSFIGVSIVDMLWRRLHAACGYSVTPWIAEIERSLEKEGLLQAFISAVEAEKRRPWSEVREDSLLKRPLLAKALLKVDPQTYPDSEAAERAIEETQRAVKEKQTPAGFTRRCLTLLDERPKFGRMFWGLDEMGQYAAGRSELLLELQSIVEQFSMQGKGRLWLAATAQERLDDVVDNYAGKSDQVAKIRDRFPKALRVELSQDDAEQVVRQRLLSKNYSEREMLESILKPYESWILTELVLRGERLPYKKPEIDDVLDCYPFLPAQFQIITEFMQGLARDMGGTADRMARGPRALIAVTQDIARRLEDRDVGALATIDLIYDEMQASIPTEDVDVVKDLDRLNDAPAIAKRVLEAAYVMEEIGENILATDQNIARTLVDQVGVMVEPAEITNAIALLIEKTFVRQVGSSGALTYRFLKAYQRKIEDDVRKQEVSLQEKRTKSAELVRRALKPLVPSTRSAFRGVRTFSLGIIVDNEFASGDFDVRLNVFSPDARSAPDEDARARSITEHAVYWVARSVANFDQELQLLVATGKVLTNRIGRVSTEEERSQLSRASEDLRQREDRLVQKLLDGFKAGSMYVEGLEVEPTAQPADAIIERLVELRYQGLWRAPIRVEEKDLDQIFQAQKPSTGPLVALGLLSNNQFSASSELAQAVLTAVKVLTFKGGATGDRLLEELRKTPNGYGDMQTRLALGALSALGLLSVHAVGGLLITREKDLPQRLRATNEFKKLTFELEQSADPIELKAVADLLEQRFDKKLAPEPPLVAQVIRMECVELRRQIIEFEGRIRNDVPQALMKLMPLKTATKAVIDSQGDGATIHQASELAPILDAWKKTLSPLVGMLDSDGIAALVDSRKLLASRDVFELVPTDAKKLQELLESDQPWQDLKQIKQLRASIGAAVRAKLEMLHVRLDELLVKASQRIQERAKECKANELIESRVVHRIKEFRCLSFSPKEDGTCRTCGSDIDTLRMKIDALPKREEETVSELLDAIKPPIPEGASNPPKRSKLSIHAALNTPREIADQSDIESIVADLRNCLESALLQDGALTVVS